MSSAVKSAYGSNNQAITITLASLGDGSARVATAIDNTSNLFLDVLVQLKIKTGGSGTSSTGYIEIYAAGTADNSDYSDGVGASDASATLTSPPNARLIGVITVTTNATTYTSHPMSVASAFGGVLPDHWSIIVVNHAGSALDSTEGNHAKFYQGVYANVG